MALIQTIAFATGKIEDVRALGEEFERDNPDAPGFLGLRVLRDRDRENAYVMIAEFETYELAMENSARPETDAFAKRFASLLDGPPRYGNYDVIGQTLRPTGQR